MRGKQTPQQGFFSYVSPEQRVPKDHPLRPLRTLVNTTLSELSPVFSKLYSHTGRPSIPPEMLLRATLLQILYSIRSERLLVEQIDYNILFRWFVGLAMDDPVWDHSSFTTNRERLLNTKIAEVFFCSVRQQAEAAGLLSDEHFTVDGTLIPAWASMKSFVSKEQGPGSGATGGGRNREVDFRGQKRTNETHGSTTDPDARLYKKADGQESKLCYLGHVLMENRNGLAVDCRLSTASGSAERTAAIAMARQVSGTRRITLGADKAYNTADFAAALRSINATPHVAQKLKGSAVDGRTTRHAGYAISQRVRKRVEEIFGWLKTIAGFHKVHVRGLAKVTGMFTFALAAYNLVRMRNLGIAASP
jgi:transposase